MAELQDSSIDDAKEIRVLVLEAFDRYKYKIPTFPGLSTNLRHVKYQANGTIYDGFLKDGVDAERLYPAVAVVDISADSDRAWFIKEEEFVKSVILPIPGVKFPKEGVFVMWDWLWDNYDEDTDDDDYGGTTESITDDTNSDIDSPDPEVTHSVVFKCIGANKDLVAQQTLAKVHSLNEAVSVTLQPEPHNPKDSQAIAFVCQIGGKPYRVGYVVREALADVHSAISSNKILSVTFEWVKYVTSWTVSGPGWFAGIKVTRRGQWSSTVIKSASTK